MNDSQRRKILDYIYNEYTGQDVLEALQNDCSSHEIYKKKVVPKIILNDVKNIFLLRFSLKEKERIETWCHKEEYYRVYEFLIKRIVDIINKR